jgi:dienelactone hydrolase
LPIRGDYEAPVVVVLDWIDTRGDLDAGRIGIWGVSLGGYYARAPPPIMTGSGPAYR